MPERVASWIAVVVASLLAACAAPPAQQRHYALGQDARVASLQPANVAIPPDGKSLPAGHGSVRQGESLYETRCGNCHDTPAFPKLWGGIGSLKTFPQKTVTSYWPYATTLYDYIERAMPPNARASLRAGDVYALTAYILAQDGIVKPDSVLDEKNLPLVRMPNRAGFFANDGKPDT